MSTIHEVVTGMPGTFFRRPEPGSAPYVLEGASVITSEVIGVIEVMKMFHELTAGADGTLLEFLVEDGDVVAMGGVVARVGLGGA